MSSANMILKPFFLLLNQNICPDLSFAICVYFEGLKFHKICVLCAS